MTKLTSNPVVQPRVSVVIPTYNRSDFLCEAVDSVLAQTFRDFEILIVDDGSTDGTRGVVDEKYGKDSRVHYIYRENSGGPAAPRNTGIAKARGDFIALLDHDDLWLPKKLDFQIQALDEHPEASLCFSDALVRGKDSETSYFKMMKFEGPPTLKRMLESDYIPSASAVVKKTCFERLGGFDETIKAADDWDMWIRVLAQYEAVFVDKPLYVHRLHEDQMSHNKVLTRRSALQVYQKHKALYLREGIGPERMQERLVAAQAAWAVERIGRGEIQEALRELHWLETVSPESMRIHWTWTLARELIRCGAEDEAWNLFCSVVKTLSPKFKADMACLFSVELVREGEAAHAWPYLLAWRNARPYRPGPYWRLLRSWWARRAKSAVTTSSG